MVGQSFFFGLISHWSCDGYGDGVVVVPIWCFLSLRFSLINMEFVDLFVLFDFYRFGLWFLFFGFLNSLCVLWDEFSWVWVLVYVFFRSVFLFLYVLFMHQTRNYLTALTCLTDDLSHRILPKHSVGCSPIFVHPIQLGWLWVNPKPDLTQHMHIPNLKPKLRENSIRFQFESQLKSNFMPYVISIFLIFVQVFTTHCKNWRAHFVF